MTDLPSAPPARLGVIVASVRNGRFAPNVAQWFLRQTAGHGLFEADLIDLREEELSLVMPDHGQGPDPRTQRALDRLSPRLAAARAFVVVTPEYNHSFPASLKNAVDWHFEEWQAKPVGFVSYGGISGGLRAVEQLRQVFAELHAVTTRDTVSFRFPDDLDATDGGLRSSDAAQRAAKTMLDQLDWWSTALNEARAKRPYPM